MEAWKLQTAINAFTDACDSGGHDIVGATKRLTRTHDMLRDWRQRKDLLEQVAPYLDDSRAEVRQCAACVMLCMPVERFSTMPPNMDIAVRDAEGVVQHRFRWEDKVPASVQQPAWMEFVARHKIFLREQRESQR